LAVDLVAGGVAARGGCTGAAFFAGTAAGGGTTPIGRTWATPGAVPNPVRVAASNKPPIVRDIGLNLFISKENPHIEVILTSLPEPPPVGTTTQ